jgi:hypothetical protein
MLSDSDTLSAMNLLRQAGHSGCVSLPPEKRFVITHAAGRAAHVIEWPHKQWRAWGLAILLLAVRPGMADDIALSNGSVINGAILQITSNSIVLLQGDDKIRTLTKDTVKRFSLDFNTGDRCARLTAADGKRSLFSLSAFDHNRVEGRDMAGKPVAFLHGDIREAVVYPVTRPRHVLDIPYVNQKPDYCGEACIQMLSTFLGRPLSQDQVNQMAGLGGKRGCYADELVGVINKLNLKIASDANWPGSTDEDFLADRMRLLGCLGRNHPVLLGVWGNPRAKTAGLAFDHIVLLIGYDLASEKFIIHDPGRWPDWEVSFADFIAHRKSDGRALCQIEFSIFRTWKTLKGVDIPAELLELKDQTIRLKSEKAEVLTLSIAELDPACASFVEKLKVGRAAPRRGDLLSQASLYVLYMSARESALRGDKAEAIGLMMRAVDGGFINFISLDRDKAFDSIREEEAVKALFANKDKLLADFIKNMTAALLMSMGDKYKVMSETNSPYVVICVGTSQSYKEVTEVLRTISDLHGRTLFNNKPTSGFIVVMPDTAEEFMRMRGGGQGGQTSAGFYNHATRTLIIRQGTGTGTIAHEFTHALHFADMEARSQMHPLWVREWLGSLYEESDPKKDYLEGLVNWRLPILQQALGAGKVFKLRELMEDSDRCFKDNNMVAYAMSRYLFFYLQRKQLLFPWYARYCEDYAGDPTGISTLEKVSGKPIEEFEAEWIGFVKTLK